MKQLLILPKGSITAKDWKPDSEPVGYLLLFSRESYDEMFPKAKAKSFRGFGMIEVFRHGETLFCYPHGDSQPFDLRFASEELGREALLNATMFGLTRASMQTIPKYLTEHVPLGTLAKINPEWESAPWIAVMAFRKLAPKPPEPWTQSGLHWINTTKSSPTH